MNVQQMLTIITRHPLKTERAATRYLSTDGILFHILINYRQLDTRGKISTHDFLTYLSQDIS